MSLKDYVVSALRRLYSVASKEVLSTTIQDLRGDVLAVQYLAPLSRSYVPWTRPAMSPSSIATILNEIIINRRRSIAECGGGISTLYIARLIQANKLNAHLYTIEHDIEWITVLEEMLRIEGLIAHVTFIYAPLKASTHRAGAEQWYDEDTITRSLDGVKVDLLIIDGPPAQPEDPTSRYPGVPFFKDYLEHNYTLVLDDAKRAGERTIISQWTKNFGMNFRVIGDLAIATTSNTYKVFV